MLQSVAVHHIADHQLIRYLTEPDVKMTQSALPCRFVIDGNIIVIDKIARDADDLRELLRLQCTVLAVDNAVAVKGVKADLQPAVLISADRELRLVSVTVGRIAGKNGLKGCLNSADALYRVAHLLLLDAAFFSIGDMPPHTAAALTEQGTVRFDTRFRRRYDLLDSAERVGLLYFYNAHPQLIADCGQRYKYCCSVLSASDAAALGSRRCDLQRDNIVLL